MQENFLFRFKRLKNGCQQSILDTNYDFSILYECVWYVYKYIFPLNHMPHNDLIDWEGLICLDWYVGFLVKTRRCQAMSNVDRKIIIKIKKNKRQDSFNVHSLIDFRCIIVYCRSFHTFNVYTRNVKEVECYIQQMQYLQFFFSKYNVI